MVTAVRNGDPIYTVAKRFGVARATVRRWVERAGEQRLDRVDGSDPLPGRRQPANKTSAQMEDRILGLRRELKEVSILGEYGAEAIRRELIQRRLRGIPALRTMGRILERRGALEGRRRIRRPAPPRGGYLPDVAAGRAELDSFDIVEGLVIQGGINVEVLHGISLPGSLPASWPKAIITAKTAVQALVEHWRRFGLPAYAHFDNDTVFQGPHHHPDAIGRVSRWCLSLGVTPVFTPPREPGFQGSVENFNGRWQGKVWARFRHTSRKSLPAKSARFLTASRHRVAQRIEQAPQRRRFPKPWTLNLQAALQGRIIFLRRTNAKGEASLLGRTFAVDSHWPHRLVRAEVHLDHHQIRFHALRRRHPAHQPLLRKLTYVLPNRRFHE